MATTAACQAAALQEHGLVVHATFIDGPAAWFDLSGAARRACSSPPALASEGEADFGIRVREGTGSPRGRPPARPAPEAVCGAKAREGSRSARSEASTASPSWQDGSPQSGHRSPRSDGSEAGDLGGAGCPEPAPLLPNEGDLWWLSAESAAACRDRAHELAGAVERGCGFMRLNGHAIQAHCSEKARRQGMAMNLRFYVRGLPSAKRAKWQQSLYWSVAAVLQRLGIDVRMQGGELRVAVQEDVFIRLEFVAGRL